MQYLLLICGDESAAEHADEGCGGWTEEMTGRGLLRVTGGLRPPAEARTVRVRRRQLLLSDGPFAETKEQIAGMVHPGVREPGRGDRGRGPAPGGELRHHRGPSDAAMSTRRGPGGGRRGVPR